MGTKYRVKPVMMLQHIVSSTNQPHVTGQNKKVAQISIISLFLKIE